MVLKQLSSIELAAVKRAASVKLESNFIRRRAGLECCRGYAHQSSSQIKGWTGQMVRANGPILRVFKRNLWEF